MRLNTWTFGLSLAAVLINTAMAPKPSSPSRTTIFGRVSTANCKLTQPNASATLDLMVRDVPTVAKLVEYENSSQATFTQVSIDALDSILINNKQNNVSDLLITIDSTNLTVKKVSEDVTHFTNTSIPLTVQQTVRFFDGRSSQTRTLKLKAPFSCELTGTGSSVWGQCPLSFVLPAFEGVKERSEMSYSLNLISN